MTPESTTQEKQRPAEPNAPIGTIEPTRQRPGELGNLEVWARSAPIRLAGYEDDLAEPHILPGID
ncbi:hypothetical protein [Streptomyces laurentii]|uniref:Uncharacterized protein n=1 Tax=Streptomyces laurentii TaxID=39478 RepID=A0A160P6J4_STRLU|nr:hypothetical protein SLA_6603 [Streptomyces laurentii]